MKKIALPLILMSAIFTSGCVTTASTVSSAVTVANERRTTGELIDDKTLSLRLMAWSVDDVKTKGAHVNFMAYDRKVLVAGEAPSDEVRDYIVSQIPVVDPKIEQVFNEISVGPNSGYLSRAKDVAISAQVEVLLYDQEVFHPTHVKVMTEKQTVYLMGKVTQREADKATKIAAKAKGVKKVVKLFDYLKTRQAQEIERDRQRELDAQKEAERKQQQAQIEAKKAELIKQLKELGGNTEGTPF